MINKQAMEELIAESTEVMLHGKKWLVEGETTEDKDVEEDMPSLRGVMQDLKSTPLKLDKETLEQSVDITLDLSTFTPEQRATTFKWLSKKETTGLSSFMRGVPTADGSNISININLAAFLEYLKTAPDSDVGTGKMLNDVTNVILASIPPEQLLEFVQRSGVYDLFTERNKASLPYASNFVSSMLRVANAYNESKDLFNEITKDMKTKLDDLDTLPAYERESIPARQAEYRADAERNTLILANNTFNEFFDSAFSYPPYPSPAKSLFSTLSFRGLSSKPVQSGGFAVQYTAARNEVVRSMMSIFLENPKFAMGLLQDKGFTAGAVREGCRIQREALAGIDVSTLNQQELHEYNARQAILTKLDVLTQAMHRLEDFATGPGLKDLPKEVKAFAAALSAQGDRVIKETIKLAPGPTQPAIRKGGKLDGRALRSSIVERAHNLAKEQARRDSFDKKIADSGENAYNIGIISDDLLAKFAEANGGRDSGPNAIDSAQIKQILMLHFGALLTVERGAATLQKLIMTRDLPGPDTTSRQKLEFLIGLCNEVYPRADVQRQGIDDFYALKSAMINPPHLGRRM